MVLGHQDDIDVVAEAGTGLEAIEAARTHRPDVILMDIRMPKMDGIWATREIVARPAPAGVHVVVVTTFELDEYVTAAIAAGASGFLVKDTEPVELLRALRVVAAGESLLAPTVTRRLISEFIARPAQRRLDTSVLSELTDREREVLALVAGGLSNDEIAAHLVISPATARTHVSRILTKLGLRGRVQAVVLAYETGLVEPGGARR